MNPKYQLLSHVFIIGMPGAGKSTLANTLSERYALPVVDLDRSIVQEMGQSIRDIWHDHGEFYFRVVERRMLLKILTQEPVIVATGGGLPCYFNNSYIINKHYSVFLNLNLDELIRRNSNTKNPLFTSDLRQEQMKTLYDNRIKYYERANRRLVGEENLEVLANNFLNFLLLDGIIQSKS